MDGSDDRPRPEDVGAPSDMPPHAPTETDADTDGLSDAPTEIGAGAQEADGEEPGTWPGTSMTLAERYQLEEAIASGGAAIVWRAFDEVLSRSVAIKLLHPHLATDEVTVERFRLESINAARLSHPNAVQIYDTGRERDVVYLVMEYIDGPSLRDLLERTGPLAPEVVAALGEQVASALGEAHEQGVVHRDIKPANILVTSDGVAKVTDFGIAKALSGTEQMLTNPGTVVGTAAYVAPEQIEGETVDARADVYALGIVLYEALTGRPAFTGDTPAATAAARLTQDPLPPRQVRADVPRALDAVVRRATSRDPHERYRDGTEMAAALAQLVTAKPADVTATLITDDVVAAAAGDDGSATAAPAGRSGRVAVTRSEYGQRLAMAFIGGLLLAAIAFFAARALQNGPAAEDEDRAGGGGEPVAAATVTDYDPFGDDAQEHPQEVPLAVDGDPTTAWTTQTYRGDPRFGALKPGVGLVLDLGEPRALSRVSIELDQPGVSLQLHASDDLHGPFTEWPPSLASVEDAGERVELNVEGEQARFWLVWLTSLPDRGDGTFRAGIAEIDLRTP